MGRTERGYFTEVDGRFTPTEIAISPWSADMIVGPCVCGLFARELENRHAVENWVPSRLTVDLFKPVRTDPVTVETTLVRDATASGWPTHRCCSATTWSRARPSCTSARRSSRPERCGPVTSIRHHRRDTRTRRLGSCPPGSAATTTRTDGPGNGPNTRIRAVNACGPDSFRSFSVKRCRRSCAPRSSVRVRAWSPTGASRASDSSTPISR